MKDIHTILDRSNLTPRERFLLLIQNDVRSHLTGKEVLTPADKAALENWNAQRNGEAQEWNQLNDGWKYTGRMGLEAEFHFNDAQAAHFQVRPIIMELLKYPLHREIRRMVEGIKGVKKVTAVQAVEITGKQRAVKLYEGMDFEYAVYRLAFERLSEKDRARLVELYSDIETDHQYLDQEEVIAHLLGGKEELTVAAKKKLAGLIAERAYNAFAKEYQLFHYFACIPLAEVARHFLESKGVTISGKPLAKNQETDDTDDLTHQQIQKAVEHYAREHDTTVEAILKEGFIHWYDAEGFAYTPLIVSTDKALFERWLKTKAEARAALQGLIDTGALHIRERAAKETRKEKLYSKGLYDAELASAQQGLELLEMSLGEKGEIDEKKAFEVFSDRVITGESLYAFVGDLEFVKEFKKRVDEYDPNLGLVYADDDPEHTGQHLDRELLICPLTSSGELSFFSMYGLSLRRLEMSLESTVFFKEEKKGGKTYLKFKNKAAEKMFKDSRDSFMAAYGKLLAHKELLRKISMIYEVDLAFRVDELLTRLDAYIETHNDALDAAQKQVQYKHVETDEEKIVAIVDQALFIDKNTIKPDLGVVEEHAEKLKKIFWSF